MISCNILSCWAQLDSVLLWDSDLQIHISKNGLHLKLKQHQLWRTALQLSQDCWLSILSNNFWIATVLLLPLSDQASLRSDTEKNNLVSPMHPLKFIIFHSTEGQTFYWSIMTAVDSIKCWCTNSGMTGQVGSFQNPEVCLQAFPSFLSPHSLPALLLAPIFHAVFDFHSSFFSPKPHRNACYAGYSTNSNHRLMRTLQCVS